ncbi:Panacea domain-containing protein [Salinarimonas ramus]|uniref:Antitoxin SocA-like Panacea domain-containing protein n=1 Tax=Salinarimonas ramus TaxID=690164 RepID=A0A917QE00_9HYPH|nr:type II toxin-antitoxin system antitoxin SocA domain-containing protein [Salinarimonas ramus]GGK45319.1 hypothetical protein GCM10011322_35670 [Salinarimonas ramus]
MQIVEKTVQPATIADFLLVSAREAGELLTNLKLQKLLYYAQAWRLALTDEPLFSEDFEAWVHGPVLPSQYHRFKDFRWMPITAPVDMPRVDEDLARHLDEILRVFGPESAVALEQMTHEERPWREARAGMPLHETSSAKISKNTMKEYYRSLMDGEDQEGQARA